ncbi:SDR family NAD(P)-dependent oxidoreductase [Leucothrix mucor]|uniref:SDR family NAD(P)-dependent oxidoreductase n=1 Tax=Leucothrix mucor TaxID=45248 RepID=UPI0003B617BC|nr:SDR family oxidoreductase [Leucothrix mucor]
MNKLALITGGSRGLGKNSALTLADKGIDVVFTYHSNQSAAQAVVDAIESKGGKAAALQLDVGDLSSFPTFVESLKSTLENNFGRDRIDYLVNNAGPGDNVSFAETTEAQFDALMNVHLKGTFFFTQSLLPVIQDGGRIINISSGLTRFSLPGYCAYAMMKGGVEVMTRYLAKELSARQIRVNTLAPGAIETDFRGGAVRDNLAINKQIASLTALGRVGLPDDIGGIVASLLSDETAWITAQRIEASGGMFI